jgi:hypothetical protein
VSGRDAKRLSHQFKLLEFGLFPHQIPGARSSDRLVSPVTEISQPNIYIEIVTGTFPNETVTAYLPMFAIVELASGRSPNGI